MTCTEGWSGLTCSSDGTVSRSLDMSLHTCRVDRLRYSSCCTTSLPTYTHTHTLLLASHTHTHHHYHTDITSYRRDISTENPSQWIPLLPTIPMAQLDVKMHSWQSLLYLEYEYRRVLTSKTTIKRYNTILPLSIKLHNTMPRHCTSLSLQPTWSAALCRSGHSVAAPGRHAGRQRRGYQGSWTGAAGTARTHSTHHAPPPAVGYWLQAADSVNQKGKGGENIRSFLHI